MDFLSHLWLPILLSSIAVWFAALIAWAALPHHKKDFIPTPDEDATIQAIKNLNLPPGNYRFPDFMSSTKINDPRVQALLNNGPVGHLTLWRTPLTMWQNMVLTFLVYLVATILIAYLGWQTLPHPPYITTTLIPPNPLLPPPASFAKIFQVLGTAGILTYAFAFIPNNLWFGAKRSAILLSILDGIAFGLITAAIFAWLWPK